MQWGSREEGASSRVGRARRRFSGAGSILDGKLKLHVRSSPVRQSWGVSQRGASETRWGPMPKRIS